MHLIHDILARLPISDLTQCNLPHYLLGAFRRKSITFFNGLTDEDTIVYWFQSKSFSIDLRLSDAHNTSIYDRQGWIGDTLWDEKNQLLSWHIEHSYQPRTQWPEPAKLYPIGNCILEFAPSGAYVEDWRQQATTGLFLGLRLKQIEHIATQQQYKMEGGLIISGQHIAMVQSRLPEIEEKFTHIADLRKAAQQHIHDDEINSYEISIALGSDEIRYSTISEHIGTAINLDQFELLQNGQLRQQKLLQGTKYFFYYELDFYSPDFHFIGQSPASIDAITWSKQEQQHLFEHAKIVT
ncbi:hypothetical protein GCM10023206_17890 [Acinetobacter puyangensis]|uniref:Uncharacterized protein n=1 Tax=Acinetobacter puyangensis TaxID=1096779 RepID=A0A240E5B9_9GAMM|nr:hypothetical protein [Acinetobacter puyangensis]SNX43948.1 hypothetical protein SAMN05421731_102106 [Acinetobacter puyangensis]